MSFATRPYQQAAIDAVEAGWAEPDVRAQLICSATGSGKTVLFSKLGEIEVKRRGRVLILAHTDELIDQAIKKFAAATGLPAGREKAESYASRFDRVVVGSVQTMQRDLRLSSWPENHFTLVIVDEAHRSLADGYQKILKHFMKGGARVVGVTATADRGDKRALGDFFQRVAFDYGLRAAVLDGWLVRPIVKTMPISIDLRGVHTRQTSDGTDLDRMEVGHRLSPYIDAIAAAVAKEIGREKVLLFLPSVETAQIMSAALNRVGVPSDWVCGDKKLCPDRNARVERHKRGEIQGLTNMAVLTEGYDDDGIKNIVCLRATKIRSLYQQIIGRGTRPHGSIVAALNAAANAAERLHLIRNSEKPFVRILDFLWEYEKHDICTPASLVSKDARIAEIMGTANGDLIEAAERAERDLLKKLEKEVQKHARRKQAVVDPLALATELGDVELATYEPETARDAMPMSAGQKKLLEQFGIRTAEIQFAGHARMVLDRVLARSKQGLATPRQLNFFKRLGVDASLWTMKEAQEKQKEQVAKWRARDEQRKAERAQAKQLELAQQPIEDLSELFGAPNGNN